MNLKKIIQALKTHKKFLISTHVNPDPDAICSELAMEGYLRFLGKKVTIVHEEDVPSRLAFLPGAQKIKNLKNYRPSDYDAAILLDCGELKRIGEVKDILQKDKPLINIDHHITNDSFGTINWIDPKASSTSEMIYEILREAGCKLNKYLAAHLYSGIMTDTGSFRFENTTARTHQIASELMKFDFSPSALYRRFYETVPLNDLKIFTKLMSRFDTYFNDRVVCVDLKKKVIAKFSDEFDLRDAIFKFLRSCKEVEVYIIFTEVNARETRVNFRSSSWVNVAQLAHHFKGGGHPRASGCVIEKDIQEARQDILAELKKLLSAFA